jgi:hypothetical protein
MQFDREHAGAIMRASIPCRKYRSFPRGVGALGYTIQRPTETTLADHRWLIVEWCFLAGISAHDGFAALMPLATANLVGCNVSGFEINPMASWFSAGSSAATDDLMSDVSDEMPEMLGDITCGLRGGDLVCYWIFEQRAPKILFTEHRLGVCQPIGAQASANLHHRVGAMRLKPIH